MNPYKQSLLSITKLFFFIKSYHQMYQVEYAQRLPSSLRGATYAKKNHKEVISGYSFTQVHNLRNSYRMSEFRFSSF